MTRPDWEYRLQSIRHTADVGLAETAKAAEYFQAEGVIISGTATGCPTDPAGVTPENMTCFAAADALIVGSSVKERGLWFNPLEEARVRAVAHAFSRNLSGSDGLRSVLCGYGLPGSHLGIGTLSSCRPH